MIGGFHPGITSSDSFSSTTVSAGSAGERNIETSGTVTGGRSSIRIQRGGAEQLHWQDVNRPGNGHWRPQASQKNVRNARISY
jgi:hypothetical protein